MKIWNSYGSEHSANLVMIGHFKEVADAKKAKETIDSIEEYMRKTGDYHEHATRYSDSISELLKELQMYSVQPSELNQFSYDISTKIENKNIIITTDEMDISAFLKILIDNGAKVEVYSAHDYKDTGKGR